MKQKKIMAMKRPQDRDEFVSNRQDSDLWVKMPLEDTETGQKQNFNEYELKQEYVKNLGMTDNIEQTYPPEKWGHKDIWCMRQLYRETKTDKM